MHTCTYITLIHNTRMCIYIINIIVCFPFCFMYVYNCISEVVNSCNTYLYGLLCSAPLNTETTTILSTFKMIANTTRGQLFLQCYNNHCGNNIKIVICDWACKNRPCERKKIADFYCVCCIIT